MPAPLTPFEQRGYTAPWTSRAEEEAWLADLIDYVDTTPGTNPITLESVGESVGGEEMWLLSIGTGPRVVLFLGQQHGQEVAGREALLTTLRMWADSTDPDLLDYLTRATVLVMPTCHPDNFTTRENLNDVNLNRDHVQLTQPETQAIHAVIRDYAPEVIVDFHEGRNITADVATAPPYNLNADTEIVGLAQQLSDAVKTAIEGAGGTWELYQGPRNMMRGPENMHNNAAVRGIVGLLMETRRVDGVNSDAQLRHDWHRIAIDTVWQWHDAQMETVASTVTEARARMAASTSPITLHVGTNQSGPVVDPHPTGYLLSDADWSAIALHRSCFGITGDETESGYHAPTAQEQQVLLAYLVDPDSDQKLVTGTRSFTSGGGGGDDLIPIGLDRSFRFRLNGQTFPATIKVKAGG